MSSDHSPGTMFHNVVLSLAALLLMGLFGWAGNQIVVNTELLQVVNVRLGRQEVELDKLAEAGYTGEDASKDFRLRDDRMDAHTGQVKLALQEVQEVRQAVQNSTKLDEIVKVIRERNVLLERLVAKQDALDTLLEQQGFRIQTLYQEVYGKRQGSSSSQPPPTGKLQQAGGDGKPLPPVDPPAHRRP